MTQLQDYQAENESLKAKVKDASETIAALTAKVAQLQNALDDKEAQFRDLIRRYSKRDANANGNCNGTANGSSTAANGNGVALKNANGSATNVSSSGVSIQSNGDTALSSAAVSPASNSAQNRSLTDSATQTMPSEDDESGTDDQFDLRVGRRVRKGATRQVSFGLSPSSKAAIQKAIISPATSSNGDSDSQQQQSVARIRRTQTNSSASSVDANGSRGHSRTPSSQTVSVPSPAIVVTPQQQQQQPNGNQNRVSYAEYAPPIQRNETDYLSLAAFACINQQAAGTLHPSSDDTDSDVAMANGGKQPVLLTQNKPSNLPSVIPVPIPVRVDSRRPESLQWPTSSSGNIGNQPLLQTQLQPGNQQVMSFVVATPVASQVQATQLASFSMTNFAVSSNGTASSTQSNQQMLATSNLPVNQPSNPQIVSLSSYTPPNNNNNSSQSSLDKQDLARRCLELSVTEWKAGHVMAWLELYAGLQPFARRCAENVKSGAILNAMSDAELEQAIGIDHVLHKRKLQLALAELRSGTYNPHLKVNSISHSWIARTWLRDIGLPQYAQAFEQALVDGRLLTTLTKKDLEKYLRVERKSHQASLIRSIELLRRFSFDLHAIGERRARCEYVNADLLVWTNRRLSVWLKEIDLVEYSNIEQTGLNGAYLLYEALSIDSLCTALGISSNKPHVRKHLEAKFNELTHAAPPTCLPSTGAGGAAQIALINGAVQGASQNGNGGVHLTMATNGVCPPNGAAAKQLSAAAQNAIASVSPNVVPLANGLTNGIGVGNRNYQSVHYAFESQLDYINLDANTPNEMASGQKSSRNYAYMDGVATKNGQQTGSAVRNGNTQQAQQTLSAARPMRNGDHRVKMDENGDAQDPDGEEQDRNKFVRSSSANRSAGRKMASLRNSIGKAFSSKKSANQADDRGN